MPKLRPYELQVSPQGPVNTPKASGRDFDTGLAMSQFGESISDVGQALGQYYERKQIFDAQLKVSQAHSDWQDKLLEKKRTAPPGAPNFTTGFLDEYDSWRNQQLESVSGSSARRVLESGLLQLRSSLKSNAYHFEADSSAANLKETLKNQWQRNENAVYADPNRLNEYLGVEKSVIDSSPFWDNQQRLQTWNMRKSALTDRALDSVVTSFETSDNVNTTDVLNALDNIQNPKSHWVKNASPNMFENAVSRLQRRAQTLSTQRQAEMFLNFEDKMKQIEMTGVDHGDYTAEWIHNNVKDSLQQARMTKRQEEARAVGRAVAYTKDQPYPAVLNYLKKLQDELPKASDPGRAMDELKGLIHAIQQRNQEFSNDPVGYTLKVSPDASKIYQKFQDNQTPENAAQYAETVMLEQKKLYPDVSPALLTEAQIAQTSALMSKISQDPEGAQRATDLIQSYASTWGKYFPIVVRDLRNGKALNDTQYVAATLFDKPQVKHIAEDLMRASLMKPEELNKLIMGERTLKDTQEAVISNLAPLRQSLGGMVDGMDIYESYVNGLTQLLLYKGAWNGDMGKLSKQAKEYANKIVLDYYSFQGTYRIPISEPSGPIKIGANRVLGSLENFDLVLPGNPFGLRDPDLKKRYVNALKDQAIFVNRGDEKGVRLIDGIGHDVFIRTKGPMIMDVPLSFTWHELRDFNVPYPFTEEVNKHIFEFSANPVLRPP